MNPLKLSARNREYKLYPSSMRGKIAYLFLLNKELGHRALDANYLGKNATITRGYQSMGILHYQGLVKDHHGVLAGMSLEATIRAVKALDESERLLGDLTAFQGYKVIDKADLESDFQLEVEQSLQDESGKRRERLLTNSGKARRLQTVSYAFERNPDVVAEALIRAVGKCEICHKPAPFIRRSNGTPYLEVHHVTALSNDGTDTLDNVLALCPNCHRERHHGQS